MTSGHYEVELHTHTGHRIEQRSDNESEAAAIWRFWCNIATENAYTALLHIERDGQHVLAASIFLGEITPLTGAEYQRAERRWLAEKP